jgi:histone H1/5
MNDYDACKKALDDTKDMQILANNELEAKQFEISEANSQLKVALESFAKLESDHKALLDSNKKLESTSKKLTKSIEALEDKELQLKEFTKSLKQIKKEEAQAQETLSLLAVELNDLEMGVESYASRKSAAESEFGAFKAKLDKDKQSVLDELANIKDRMAQSTLACGKEMGRLDQAIAERISEMQEMETLIGQKDYEFVSIQSKIRTAEDKIKDAEERAEYLVNKAEEKVKRIKSNFEDWKVNTLDDVAKLKLRGKIQNIDKAGLKELLDG